VKDLACKASPFFNLNCIPKILKIWRQRAYNRRQLALLDSRLLMDAGLTEEQRYQEIRKPFWKA
jgi:uncharacterized protein YjiS (DUF1127 family)